MNGLSSPLSKLYKGFYRNQRAVRVRPRGSWSVYKSSTSVEVSALSSSQESVTHHVFECFRLKYDLEW